ncbi:MAG: hypothetical protein [Microvirus sp.]|nr:MAG: hypothetical protein [Microvirus sp.]
MGSETTEIVIDRGSALVCSVFDVVAKEHGPLFYAINMGLLWRNIDGLMKQAQNVSKSDFVVVVHGVITLDRPGRSIDLYDYPNFFTVDREPISGDTVRLMTEGK